MTPAVAPAQTAPVEDAAASQIQDIVVTAERRQGSAQKVPGSLLVIPSDIANSRVTETQELSTLVPTLNISLGGSGSTQLAIRGVGSFSNPYSEQAVATNIDGIYIARSAATAGVLFDIDRIEVLKGPQGTLYGRNATAGAINFITNKPAFERGGEATFEIGNYRGRRVAAAVNLPTSSVLSFRLATQLVSHDGYFSDGYGDLNSKAVRGSVRYQPSDSFKIDASLDYSNQHENGAGSIVSSAFDPDHPFRGSTTPEGNAPYVAAGVPGLKDDGFLHAHFFGGAANIEWDTGAGRLSIVPGFRHSVIDALTYTPGFPLATYENSDLASVETRFASPADRPFSYIVGTYAYHEEYRFNSFANLFITSSESHVPKLDTTALAAFAQATLRLGDATRVTAGARYSTDRKKLLGTVTTPLPPVPPFLYPVVCPPPGAPDLTTVSCTIPVQGSARFRKTTWRFVVEHDLTPSNLIYANVGTGFKAGGFYASLPPDTFKPENLLAFAAGSKNRFFDRRLQLNFEGFYWDYKNIQVSHLGPVRPAGFDLITENAGRAKIYGGEVEALWKITPHDQVSVDGQYTHSRYSSFVYTQDTTTGPPTTTCRVAPLAGSSVSVDCSGNVLNKSPRWSGNVAFAHTLDLRSGAVTLTVFERFSTGYWLGDEHLPDEYQRSYQATDVDLTYALTNSRISISAFLRNAENRAIRSTAFVQPVLHKSVYALQSPRTFGIRLHAAF